MADSSSFSFPKIQQSDLPAQNPLLAKATVTDRSDRTTSASVRPLGQDAGGPAAKAMPPPARRPGKVPLEKGYSQMDWMRVQKTERDLAGLHGRPLRKDITLEEVKRHSSVDDAWTVLKGKVYNITPYMRFHPGGVSQLQRGAGIDSTSLFIKYHAWVNADMLLEKCLIGFLAKPMWTNESARKGEGLLKVVTAAIEQGRHPVSPEREHKGLDSAVADAQTYDELEKNFERVLQELEPARSLDNFRSQYETVLQAVRRSHDNEKRLAAKCKQLNKNLVGAAARVTAALRLSEEDQTTIATLRKELEKTWKRIDAGHDKENRLRAEMADLRLELEAMTRLVEENKEHEAALDDLLKHKQELLQERDNQMAEILAMRQEADQLREQLKVAESQKEEAEANLEAFRIESASKKAEQERDMKRRENLEREVRDLKGAVNARQVELRNRAAEAQSAENALKDYELQIRELHVAANRVNKEYTELANQGNRIQREVDAQTASCAQLSADNSARTSALKAAEASLATARADNARLARTAEATAARLRASEEKRTALEEQRDDLRNKASNLEREKDAGQRNIAVMESRLASLHHELDVLSKLKAQADGSTHHQMDLVKVHESHMRVLEGELAAHKATAHEAAQQEAALVREREGLALQGKHLAARLAEAHAQLDQKAREAAEVQATIEEREALVASQQKAYEKVRAERNRTSHDLIAAQAEVAEAKRRYARVAHQVELLRADLKAKDKAYLKEKFEHSKADAERQTLLTELGAVEKALATHQQEASTMRTELGRMSSIIAEADQERARQRKEYEAVMSDRDVLGTQLVRRNDEVALLYAKLRLQTTALQAGQLAYRDRLAELRLAKAGALALQRDLAAARRQGSAAGDLTREVTYLTKKLQHEQVKSKALSEELETPLNVHRWRKLEGSDPAAYELIQKVQLLQRRLIRASEQLVERDLQIQEKEQLCHQLQALVKRSPGTDAAAALALSQADLREKAKRLHAMRGELGLRHAQVDDYKMSIKRMQAEIDALKGHFFVNKRLYEQGLRRPVSAGSSVLIEKIYDQPPGLPPAAPLAVAAA